MENPDPVVFQPHLDAFSNDKYLPCAILLEYIPQMRDIDTITYSEERWERAVEGIELIHEALVLHKDTYPKNTVITSDHPERVLWIDFDRAETYEEDHVAPKQKDWIDLEFECIVDMGRLLVRRNPPLPKWSVINLTFAKRRKIRQRDYHRIRNITKL
jgi:hypothetical protein